MKSIAEEVLDNTFKSKGIRKAWIPESKEAVLEAMEAYLTHPDVKISPTEKPQYKDDDCRSGHKH